MDSNDWDFAETFLKWMTPIIFLWLILVIITTNFSNIEAQVKVQEVGTRYAFLNFGEQEYIRIQNAYSEQYSASSESWETCIDYRDMAKFKLVKNNRTTINIIVKGYGISTVFTCLTGDRVIEIKD